MNKTCVPKVVADEVATRKVKDHVDKHLDIKPFSKSSFAFCQNLICYILRHQNFEKTNFDNPKHQGMQPRNFIAEIFTLFIEITKPDYIFSLLKKLGLIISIAHPK